MCNLANNFICLYFSKQKTLPQNISAISNLRHFKVLQYLFFFFLSMNEVQLCAVSGVYAIVFDLLKPLHRPCHSFI